MYGLWLDRSKWLPWLGLLLLAVAGVALVISPYGAKHLRPFGPSSTSVEANLASHGSPSPRSPAPVRTSAGAGAKVEDHSLDITERDSIVVFKLDPTTNKNVTDAVRTWAAYPSRKGRTATLAKLRLNQSVSAVAFKDVSRQWARSQTDPVNVMVDKVVINVLPVFATATQATIEGTVTLSKRYSDGKITRVLNPVNILLAKNGGVWQIVRLVML